MDLTAAGALIEASPELVEREPALAAVHDALAGACAGTGQAVFLVGEPGLGKTALLQAAREQADGALTVRSAHGASMERDLAFGYIEQCFGATSPGAPPPDETGGPAGSLGRRQSVHDLVRAGIQAWAAAGPLLLLLDDLQWADRDSLDVIAFLARRLTGLPVALVGAARIWPLDAYARVQSLERDGAARVVHLPALSHTASDGLLTRLLGTPGRDARLAERAWAVARGNPLLLQQVAKVVASEGDLPPTDQSLAGRHQLRRAVLLSHLSDMTPESLECARAAAVLGSRVRIAAVEAIAGVRPADFLESFDALAGASVLRDAGSGVVGFGHDLVASAIYEDMAPARRRELHHRAFTYYADRGDIAAAAPHALAADLEGDDRAVTAVADSGALALVDGAVGTAVAQLDAAVKLAGPVVPDWLLRRQGDTLLAVGKATEALRVYRRLLARPLTAELRQEIEVRAIRATAHTGSLDEAVAGFDALLAGCADGDEAATRIRTERARVVWERDGPAAALAALAPHLGQDGAASDLARLMCAYFGLETGDPSGLVQVEQASTAALRQIESGAPPPAASFSAVCFHVNAYAMTERYDEALALTERAGHHLRAAGALHATLPLRIVGLGIRLARGQLDAVLAEADDLEGEFELGELVRPHVQLFRAGALVWQGRLAEATAVCQATATSQGAQSWFAAISLDIVRARVLLASGHAASAVDAFGRVRAAALRSGVRQPCSPMWAASAVEAALAADRLDEVDAVVDWLAACNTLHEGTWAAMVAAAARAGAAAARGELDQADRLYRQALAMPCTASLHRAVIGVRYGSWLRRSHQMLAARPVLADALRVAEERGAPLLAADARAELAASGGRRRGARSGELTAQERRVAAFAADGASTREIALALRVSTHTVETHLTHAYGKLGVNSKRELRRHRETFDPM